MTATFIVEDGSSVANANSFVSVAYADQYNDDHKALAAWTSATQPQKEQALRMGTQFLVVTYFDRWIGYRTWSTVQNLPWPRWNVIVDGVWRPSNVMPPELLDATCELAFRYIANADLLPDIPQGTGDAIDERVVIGPLEFETKYGESASSYDLYTVVERMLRAITMSGVTVYRG